MNLARENTAETTNRREVVDMEEGLEENDNEGIDAPYPMLILR